MRTQKNRLVALNVRIPRTLKEAIGICIALDSYKDISEFARDALREKVQRCTRALPVDYSTRAYENTTPRSSTRVTR